MQDGIAPIHLAVANGHLETLQALIEGSADIECRTERV